jgi:hypothetical protein
MEQWHQPKKKSQATRQGQQQNQERPQPPPGAPSSPRPYSSVQPHGKNILTNENQYKILSNMEDEANPNLDPKLHAEGDLNPSLGGGAEGKVLSQKI